MGWLNNLINKAKKKTEETVQGAIQQGKQVVQNAVQNVSSGYGDWLNGVEQQVTPIVQNAVQQGQQAVQGVIDQGNQAIQQGVQYAKDAAGNLVEQATPIVQNAIQQGQQAVQGAIAQGKQELQTTAQQGEQYIKDAVGNLVEQATPIVQNAVQQGQQMVQNTVQNVSQGVTDKVNDINNQIQGNNTGVQIQPPVQPVPEQVEQNPVTPTEPTQTPQIVPEQTPTDTPTNTTTETPSQENDSFTADEPILSYEDYLKKEPEGLEYIKDKVTQQIDNENTETLKHIDEKLTSSTEYATDVKETTDKSLQEQKNDVYKYAEETLAGALGYNQEAYGKLVEAITSQMEAGKLAASEAKNLLMIMAEEAKNTTYGAAERQRQEAERQADINRQRAIADANSAYEQNKASYGAKAEALGNMGLTAGGYGDWLNASAYAQQRGEVQGARAQSDAAKREAKYTEDMTKLQADQEYSNKKYQAESEYQNKLYDIDTSYLTNMSEAEQSKLAADKAAYDTERDTKQKADGDYAAGKLQSDIEYKGFLYESEQEAKDQKLQANQDAANKKLQAEISYVEGILGNSEALAEYKESLKAGDAAAEEKKLAVYEQLLKGVNDGTYTAEDAAALADAFEFSQEWKDAIANSAGNKVESDANAKAEGEQMQNRQDYTSVLVGVANGELDEATATALAKEYGFSKEQTDAIIKAAQGRASGETGDMFIDTLINASNGKLDEATATAIAKQYGFNEEQTNAVVEAVQGAAGKVQKEQRTQNFNTLLDKAKTGTLTKNEVMQMASELGFDANNKEDKKLLDLIGSAADRYATATEEEKKYQKNMNVLSLLDGAKTGAYGEDEIDNIASMLGLDPEKDKGLINMIKTAAGDYADGVTKSEDQQKTNAFINLLGSANAGELTAKELEHLAGKMGLSQDEVSMLTAAAGRAASGDAAAMDAAKAQNFGILLDGAKTGAYGADEVEAMAKMLGLDPKNEADKKLIDMLTGAASAYETDVAANITKSEEAERTSDFITLLGSAGSGELTKEEVTQIAEMLGFDPEADKELLDLIGTAADRYASGTAEELAAQKTMNFISLLDGANTGAYNSTQIAQMAEMLGLDPNNEADAELIDMLKTAADDFAAGEAGKTTKEDMQYQNAIYSELLAAANNGDYTEAQIKDLANRFGIEDPDNILGDAAKLAQEGKDKTTSQNSSLNIMDLKDRGYINAETTDDEIDDFVDAGLISKDDVEKVKEERNSIAKTEVEDLIESGNYDGAIKKAEELYAEGTGNLDPDTYQKAYFEGQKNNCSQVKTVDDIKTCEAELKNALSAGQISQADYDSLVSYMYQSVGGVIKNGECTIIKNESDYTVTIGETSYITDWKKNHTISSEVKGALDKISNGEHNLVMFDGVLYCKSSDNSWFALKDKAGLYEAYNKQCGYQPNVTAPKHAADEPEQKGDKNNISSKGNATGGGGIYYQTMKQ